MKRNKLMEELREQITPEIRELVDNEGFKCPYNDFSCTHIDTSGMSIDSGCDKCEYYHNGVRATGAMPMIAKLCKWMKQTKKEKK